MCGYEPPESAERPILTRPSEVLRSFRSQVYSLTDPGPFQRLGIRVIQMVAANPIITGAVVGETSFMLEIGGYRTVYVRSNQDYEALAAALRKLE